MTTFFALLHEYKLYEELKAVNFTILAFKATKYISLFIMDTASVEIG